MTNAVLLTLIGLVLGLVGSGVLAYSLNAALDALALSTDAHDIALQGIVDPAPGARIYRFTGTDVHVERGIKRGRQLTRLGFGLLVVSFGLQAAAVLISVA